MNNTNYGESNGNGIYLSMLSSEIKVEFIFTMFTFLMATLLLRTYCNLRHIFDGSYFFEIIIHLVVEISAFSII